MTPDACKTRPTLCPEGPSVQARDIGQSPSAPTSSLGSTSPKNPREDSGIELAEAFALVYPAKPSATNPPRRKLVVRDLGHFNLGKVSYSNKVLVRMQYAWLHGICEFGATTLLETVSATSFRAVVLGTPERDLMQNSKSCRSRVSQSVRRHAQNA